MGSDTQISNLESTLFGRSPNLDSGLENSYMLRFLKKIYIHGGDILLKPPQKIKFLFNHHISSIKIHLGVGVFFVLQIRLKSKPNLSISPLHFKVAVHFSIDQSLVRFEIFAVAYQLCIEKDGGKTQ